MCCVPALFVVCGKFTKFTSFKSQKIFQLIRRRTKSRPVNWMTVRMGYDSATTSPMGASRTTLRWDAGAFSVNWPRRKWKKPSGSISTSATKRKRRKRKGYTVSRKLWNWDTRAILRHLLYGECPNRSLFYWSAVACNPSTQPVLSAQLTEEFRNYTSNLSNHTKNRAQAAGFVAELRCKICPAACYFVVV